MKTIAQYLQDEIHYPVSKGFLENRLIARGYEANAEISPEIISSSQFIGAIADSLFSLIAAPNFSESDISISLSDKNLILKHANQLYESIGEEPKNLTEPKVFIGG